MDLLEFINQEITAQVELSKRNAKFAAQVYYRNKQYREFTACFNDDIGLDYIDYQEMSEDQDLIRCCVYLYLENVSKDNNIMLAILEYENNHQAMYVHFDITWEDIQDTVTAIIEDLTEIRNTNNL